MLDTELLVRESGKIAVLPYSRLRVEILPPSGRREFDMQMECAPMAGSGPDLKPLKMELSLIAAEEFGGVVEVLTGTCAPYAP
jgi:hypothetical protein